MFDFPVWSTGWAEVFGGLFFAGLMAKFMRAETRVLLLTLCGVVLVDHWVALFVGPLVALILSVADIAKRIGA